MDYERTVARCETPRYCTEMTNNAPLSSRKHSIPQPSARYAKTAGQLRGLGVAIRNDDFELIDDYRGQLRKIRRAYPELSRRRQQLTAFEGIMMQRLHEVRALMQ
jgi:hypothetical protein